MYITSKHCCLSFLELLLILGASGTLERIANLKKAVKNLQTKMGHLRQLVMKGSEVLKLVYVLLSNSNPHSSSFLLDLLLLMATRNVRTAEGCGIQKASVFNCS